MQEILIGHIKKEGCGVASKRNEGVKRGGQVYFVDIWHSMQKPNRERWRQFLT